MFYEKIQDGGKTISDKECQKTLWAKNFVKIPLSQEINVKKLFTKNFKMTTKNGRKTIFGRTMQDDHVYPGGQKFCQNRSILHCFQDECIFAFYTEFKDGHQI